MMKLKKIITEGIKNKTGIFLALPQVFLTTTTWDEKKVLQKKNSFKKNNKQMETCHFISELKENASLMHTPPPNISRP